MSGLLQQLDISLRLHFRNPMGLIYGYLFPLTFLVAFAVLYRYEQVPLARHMGELLTVTVLGGACFGLPTTMVSERERGVWRRYRLAPVPAGSLVASTVIARYFILITAGGLQLALAMGIGMPLPRHPFDLWLAFTCVAFAFLGLGLVIAALADTVPAVQALGQCIFLPMLIIGGVAVPLSSLPAWAQHLSAFFPGRYAVDLMQACVTGAGLGPQRFSLVALLVIGGAGMLAGAQMFRWDAQQRFIARDGKSWIVVALAAWAAVGVMAESRGRVQVAAPATSDGNRATIDFTRSVAPPSPSPVETPPAAPATSSAPAVAPRSEPTTPPTAVPAPPPTIPPASGSPDKKLEPAVPASAAPSWQAVTMKHIEDDLVFDRLPPDSGVVTPIASSDDELPPDLADQLEEVRRKLPDWAFAKVADPVQRVRNYLLVAAAPDVWQMPIERHLPVVVFESLEAAVPKDQLIKILYWIALHPTGGDEQAIDDLGSVGLETRPLDVDEVRNRAAIYAVKLLGRLTGKLTP